ncbi:hypothetical protein AYI70_g5270 [Smittium culicis]|uniref:Uncharacterized protein n=1 Tax=Smittium culicis TaxID=133412 RepID=A0A1R1XVB3_9FUNG|nr:hypothetical protein AYI70_g5270 [Smittium culicis]
MMYLYCPKIYEEYLLTELELGTAQDYIEANSEIEGCKSKISNFLYHYYQQKNFTEDQSFEPYDNQTDKHKDVLDESTPKRPRFENESIEESDLETLKKPKLDSGASDLKNDSQYSENFDKTNNRSSIYKKINYTVLVYPISNRFGKISKSNIVNESVTPGSASKNLVGHLTFENADGVLSALLSSNLSVPSIGVAKNSFVIKVELKNLGSRWKKYDNIRRSFVIKNVPTNFDFEIVKQAIVKTRIESTDLDYENSRNINGITSMNIVKKSSNPENKLCIIYITMSSEQGVVSGIKSLTENLPEYQRLGMVAEEFIPTVDMNKNFDFDLNNSVYVSNINYNTERDNMIDFFRAYLGTDMFILDMVTDNNGSFSGQAFIYLASEVT